MHSSFGGGSEIDINVCYSLSVPQLGLTARTSRSLNAAAAQQTLWTALYDARWKTRLFIQAGFLPTRAHFWQRHSALLAGGGARLSTPEDDHFTFHLSVHLGHAGAWSGCALFEGGGAITLCHGSHAGAWSGCALFEGGGAITLCHGDDSKPSAIQLHIGKKADMIEDDLPPAASAAWASLHATLMVSRSSDKKMACLVILPCVPPPHYRHIRSISA